MKRKLILILISIFLISPIVLSINVNAGKAGVGVLNVAPEYSDISIQQHDDSIRLYLTASDYNSWEDIYEVAVVLEYYDSTIATFRFKQYEDTTSYDKYNEFSEDSDNKNLLDIERCSYSHSNKRETVEQRCDLDLTFVFKTTRFTRLKIVIKDRAGESATTEVDYDAEEMTRNSELLVIPWLDEMIAVQIPAFLPDLIALIFAILGTIFIG
jgi:hypothetical protein